MERIVETDFSKLCVDVGVWVVAKVFIEEVYQRVVNFGSHKLYLNAVLGCGSGASIALLMCLTIGQLISCGTLVIPLLFQRLGTAVPSLALETTILIEMALYHGFADKQLCIKSIFLSLALLIVGLLRGKQRARHYAIGTPLHGAHLSMEAAVRKTCSRLKTGTLLPPICLLVVLRAFTFNCYWRHTGTLFEIERTNFLTLASACAVLLLVAGQDRSESNHVALQITSWYRLQYKRAFKAVYGHVPDGKKKRL
jgi:hypothetical protein